ncbi:response regulator [Aquincola tertiaricarbonis]|uniref:response regulator n=1 Tax=Aquincola tertiaricarbonis TaxID=391953 RepID=UPI000614DEBC|nr:response regulator [Aquincola tertiaricarbonis]
MKPPADPSPLPQVLLVEPQFVLRRTVATVARELGIAQVHEAASHEAAARLLADLRFDALVLDIDADGRALRLLAQLRAGSAGGPGAQASPPGLPVLALIDPAGPPAAAPLAALQVSLLLARPFKARTLLNAVEGLAR